MAGKARFLDRLPSAEPACVACAAGHFDLVVRVGRAPDQEQMAQRPAIGHGRRRQPQQKHRERPPQGPQPPVLVFAGHQ